IACKEVSHIDELGDLTTLANPQVVEELMKNVLRQ
ncbi:TPA: AMP-binding enzyme, partial [Legionella pneumophila]